jgi:hypothetical protein
MKTRLQITLGAVINGFSEGDCQSCNRKMNCGRLIVNCQVVIANQAVVVVGIEASAVCFHGLAAQVPMVIYKNMNRFIKLGPCENKNHKN